MAATAFMDVITVVNELRAALTETEIIKGESWPLQPSLAHQLRHFWPMVRTDFVASPLTACPYNPTYPVRPRPS